ncbi:MAG: hypothetical protein K2H46_12390 [Muribaculaceae bacterium]|nr:hypothetical protein [Muribaculaceae bacterium]
MKFNKFYILAAGVALALTSCGEGQYWNEASNPDVVYSFPKPAATISLLPEDQAPSTYTFLITRNNAGPAVTVPVDFSTSSDLLTGAEEITFAAGETSVEYTISIEDNILIGEKHIVTITLDTPDEDDNKTLVSIPDNNKKFTFTIGRDYTWLTMGTADVISSFAGNEEPEEVPFQQAKEYDEDGNKLLRLVSPYYAMDPDYSEDGVSIQFVVNADNDAVALYPAWQYTGESDSNGYYFLGTPDGYGDGFFNEGNIYTISGVVATAPSPNGGQLTLRYYETLMFQLNWK